MLNGFEEETGPMTTEEISLVPLFVKGFEKRIGAANAVTATQIGFKLRGLGYHVHGARVRKIVNHIRMKGIVKNLVATSVGYYIENDPEKIREYVNSLRARASAIMAVADTYNIN